MEDDNEKGLPVDIDLIGLGKAAKAIPEEVYTRSTSTVLQTFEDIVAPLTATTTGIACLIRQKFDNMALAQKALAMHTVKQAIEKAGVKSGILRSIEIHPKIFLKVLEESSLETDSILHTCWVNLLACQLKNDAPHPHFVEILSHFTCAEAQLLSSLRPKSEIGDHGGAYLMYDRDSFDQWIGHSADPAPKPWTLSCRLLMEFGLTHILALKEAEKDSPAILYRTLSGEAFLKTVTEPNIDQGVDPNA